MSTVVIGGHTYEVCPDCTVVSYGNITCPTCVVFMNEHYGFTVPAPAPEAFGWPLGPDDVVAFARRLRVKDGAS